MKIRSGFVSNSSSSSFAIFGATFREGAYDGFAEKMFSEEENEKGYARDMVDEALGEKGYSSYDTEYDGIYIGVDAGGIFEAMKEGETKQQFLDRIATDLKEILKLDELPKVGYHSGEYPS